MPGSDFLKKSGEKLGLPLLIGGSLNILCRSLVQLAPEGGGADSQLFSGLCPVAAAFLEHLVDDAHLLLAQQLAGVLGCVLKFLLLVPRPLVHVLTHVIRSDGGVAAGHHQSLQQAFEFPHIARIAVAQQARHGFGVDARSGPAKAFADLLEEVVDQHGHALAAFT